MELTDYDPHRAIGGVTAYAKFMTRTRTEHDDNWHPVMDAFHTFDDLVLRYEIPGVLPEDIQLRVDGRVLYVRGERRSPEAVPAELSMRAERTYGPFDRSVVLPDGTDPAGVRASYLHGVLEIRIAHVRRPEPTDVHPDVSQPETTTITVPGT
jgi:HSP20 family protein